MVTLRKHRALHRDGFSSKGDGLEESPNCIFYQSINKIFNVGLREQRGNRSHRNAVLIVPD